MDGSFGLFTDLPTTPVTSRRLRRDRKPGGGEATGHHHWPLADGLNVVLFAGVGGACQGLEEAGFPVHVAVNHNPVAIAAHRALNPHTRHLQTDIHEVCPLDATGRRRVNILWASPDCRDHSVAKGGAPRSPRVRSMPWQICRWTGTLRKRGLGPAVVYLENVREIRGWGPLVAKRDKATGRVLVATYSRDQRTGKRNPAPLIRVAKDRERVPVQRQILVRDPRRVGRTYRAWVRHMRRFESSVYEDRDLCCADYGVPTSRRRLFGVARFDGQAPVWPEQTHASRKDLARLNAERSERGLPLLLPHRAAAEIIDWSLPLPSIFDRRKALAPATNKRLATGVKRFVLTHPSPFLVHLTHHGERGVHDAGQPVPTITGAHRGELGVVVPAIVPVCHSRDGSGRVHDGAEPVPTQTTAKGGELAVAAMHLTRYHGERRPDEARGIDPADPLATQTTENRFGVVGATLAPHTVVFRGDSTGTSSADPLPTVTANSFHQRPGGAVPIGVAGAVLAPAIMCNNENNVGADALDSVPTVTTGNRNFVVGATLVQTGYGERKGQAPWALDIAEPIGTQVAGGGKHAVVGVFLEEHRTRSVGQEAAAPLGTVTGKEHHAVVGVWMVKQSTDVVGLSPTEPMSTLVTSIGPQAIGAAFLAEYRGTSKDGQPVTDAAPTMCTGGGRGGSHSAPVLVHLSVDMPVEQYERARQVADFLRVHGAWDGGELVTVVIGGVLYVVVDIGMRMLTPAEAAAAHELRMPEEIEIDGTRRPLTKTDAMALVGNSVPARMAKLLAAANANHFFRPTPAMAAAA